MRLLLLASALVYAWPYVAALFPDAIWPLALCLWLWSEGHPDHVRRLLGT